MMSCKKCVFALLVSSGLLLAEVGNVSAVTQTTRAVGNNLDNKAMALPMGRLQWTKMSDELIAPLSSEVFQSNTKSTESSSESPLYRPLLQMAASTPPSEGEKTAIAIDPTAAVAVTIWGGVTGTWDSATGVLTLTGGTLSSAPEGTWGTVDKTLVTKVAFTNGVPLMTTDLSQWFEGCTELTSVEGLDKLDVSTVGDMTDMFYGCEKLTSVGDISQWHTSNVYSLNSMFLGCSSLESVDVGQWDIAQVKYMQGMFSECVNLTSVGDLSKWNTASVESIWHMFRYCENLTDVGNLDNWVLSKVQTLEYLFHGCTNLKNVGDLSNWDVSNVVDMNSVFSGCENLTSVGDLSNWVMSRVSNMRYFFQNCHKLVNIGNLNDWEISQVTDVTHLFYACYSLTTVEIGDFSNWNLNNVSSASGMFAECENLTEIDVTKFGMESTTKIRGMFRDCQNLTKIDVSNWNTENVEEWADLFKDCINLTDIVGISNLQLTKAWEMSSVFENCEKLTKLDLSSWNTGAVTDMTNMFKNTISLGRLTLGAAFQFVGGDLAGLPEVTSSDVTTNVWQNVGTGALSNPTGAHVMTSKDLMLNYDGATMADTYVWQPRRAAVLVKDSTIALNEPWAAKDNFIQLTTNAGGVITDFNDAVAEGMQISGSVDTSVEGTTPIEYSYEGNVETANVTVERVEPQNPAPTFPHDPNLMISITVPTSLAFGSVSDMTIRSNDYEIVNHSSLPVQVEVTNYEDVTPDTFSYFDELKLMTDGAYAEAEDVVLVNGGVGSITAATQFMNLSAGSQTPTDATENATLESNGWAKSATFEFGGTVEQSAFDSYKGKVDHNLILKFTALNVNGQGAWDGVGWTLAP